MNNIPMIFIRPDKHHSAGTILKGIDNGELHFLPTAIRKKKTRKWYIILFALLILHVLNYVSLHTIFKNQQNYLGLYILLSIFISFAGTILYVKISYNYKNIENDLIYIGKDTESLKSYFDNLLSNEEIKFFKYNNRLPKRSPILANSGDYYRENNVAIYINDKIITNISSSQNLKLRFYYLSFIGILFFLILPVCVIQLDYTLVRSSWILGLFLLPMCFGMIALAFLKILMTFNGRFSQQIEMINFLVDKYGKKENEK